MGLFSSKKVVYVSSVAYNLAGPLTDRMSILKSTVSRHVLLGEKKKGLGERIVETQMRGPTMSQRNWFRWARNNYLIGQVTGQTDNKQLIDEVVMTPYITVPAGFTMLFDNAFFDSADISYWAEQHILNTAPALYQTDWVADYDNLTGLMHIQYEDLSSENVAVTGFIQGAIYVVAYYRLLADGETDELAATPKLFIYRVGTGNPALDVLFTPSDPSPEFFPAIPLRIDNLPIDHESFDAHFAVISKAYKKATGEKIDKILESIEDNENVGDVDYATLVFGVEITTQEKCGLRYLYEFFKSLIPDQSTSDAEFQAFLAALALAPQPTPAVTTIRVSGVDPFLSHVDTRLNWITIDEVLSSGLGKPEAKVGDLWFEDMPGIVVLGSPWRGPEDVIYYSGGYTIPYSKLYWQVGAGNYKVLHLYGMVFENFVYGGKSVTLSTSDALSGDDEEGFIVPLHYPTLVKLPLVLSNQLALSNRHVVFNCYTVVKIRWYQRGIFKILIAIVIAIVTAFVFPGAVGLLGTALQVGTYFGFSGITAIIVGATVNALAAMVLMTIIEKASIAIFGEAWGRLIGQILAFFVFQGVQNMAMGNGFAIDWGSIMRMENLMGLLDSAVKGIGGWIQGEMLGLQGDMEKAGKDFKSEWEKLENKAQDLLGAGGGVIDPLMFTQAPDRFLTTESRDAFLQRTLMTGSDLIDLSMTMIEDFTDINLSVDTELI